MSCRKIVTENRYDLPSGGTGLKEICEWACKPGSVTSTRTCLPTIIYLCTTIARRLNCDLPECRYETGRLADSAVPNRCILFGLAPDGVYQAGRVTPTAGALLPHRFTLTTHPADMPKQIRWGPFGGLLSVALSLASRPVDVIDHPALRSPDFPPAVKKTASDRPTHSQNQQT